MSTRTARVRPLREPGADALAALETVAVDEHAARRLGLSPGPLRLRRAWPRSAEHLLLEWASPDGELVVGQWWAEPERAPRAAARAAAGGLRMAVAGEGRSRALLQAGGADPRLPALAALAEGRDAELVAHRPGRRGVVRLGAARAPEYAKLLRSDRFAAALRTVRGAGGLVGDGLGWPRLLHHDRERCMLVTAAAAGHSLHDLLGRDGAPRAARAAGLALADLAASAVDTSLTRHDADAEIAVLRTWVARLRAYAPDLGPTVASALGTVEQALSAGPVEAPPALLHRDLHDKQLFVTDDGRVELIDLDTLALGERALDLANLLVHLELRALQRVTSPATSRACAAALLEGAEPPGAARRRLDAYADAARLRLACVYAFRPAWRGLVPALLERIGQPPAP